MQQPGGTQTQTQTPTRPASIYIVVGLMLLGCLLTFVAAYLDQRFLVRMFEGNHDVQQMLPTFTTARLVANIVGVVVALGLLVPTSLGVNWARVLLAVTCVVYAVANLGAALGAGFTLVAGRGMFNQGNTSTTTNVSVLNGLSLGVDMVLVLVVVVCAVMLLSGRIKAYAKTRAVGR